MANRSDDAYHYDDHQAYSSLELVEHDTHANASERDLRWSGKDADRFATTP